MNVEILGAEFNYVDDKLTFQSFRVEISIGYTPKNIGGEIQLTTEDGVSEKSTKQEVVEAAKDYVLKTASSEAPKYPGLD